MTSERRLFDKPMNELREAFVRNRFGESVVFGKSEIETWLKWQREQKRPDEVTWVPFLSHDFMVMCTATAPFAHLRERATSFASLGRTGTEKGAYGRIYFLLTGGLYWGHRDTGVYADSASEMFVLSGAEDQLTMRRIGDRNRHLGASAVLDVLFAEWDRQRPRWQEARAFLCNALGEEIKRERAKAEADFDSAVAVSADGTKIWCADRVVVLSADKQRILGEFPPKAFHGRKILLAPSDDRCRVPTDVRPHLITDEAAEQMQRGEYGPMARFILSVRRAEYRNSSVSQALCNFAWLLPETPGLAQVLCTTERFCPSPLPDVGVEVTV
ncbi:hypothetical protein HY480_03465 [Candidatus Uhrbacteria bacterium]|nr:hypothetical protein [Candidatus Uhrbacteria bacterium]